MDLTLRDATSQLAALEARQVSARELLALHLARKDMLDPGINAVIRTLPDRGAAAALAIDEARALGRPLGPLAGLPMTVKDGFDVGGLPAHAGNPAYLGRPPDCADAAMVGKVKAAGAVVWGKTNVPFNLRDGQSYSDLYGATNNPYDPGLTPGGSSGGAAAALAAGITPLEIGSDIGGSLRNPASFCGVLALKPTWGRLSRAGHVPPAPGKDAESEIGVVGPMARSARDLRLLWRVLAESPATAATVPSLQGRVLALWTEGFVLERRVKRMVEAAALSLEGLGARIAPIAAPVDLARMMPAYRDLIAAIPRHGAPAHDLGVRERLAAGLGAVRRALGAPAFSRAGFALANAASAARLARARDARARMKARMATLFETTHAIIAPTVFRPAFPHDHAGGMEDRTLLADGAVVPYFALIDWIALASVLDLPAISVPFGATPEGLPIGVQVIGPWGSEERLLDIAELLELTGRGFVAPQL